MDTFGFIVGMVIFGLLIDNGLTNIGKGLSNLGEYLSKKMED